MKLALDHSCIVSSIPISKIGNQKKYEWVYFQNLETTKDALEPPVIGDRRKCPQKRRNEIEITISVIQNHREK